MRKYKSLNKQMDVLNYDELQKRREPERQDRKITSLIQSVEANAKGNKNITVDDDYEFFQWFTKNKEDEENRKHKEAAELASRFKRLKAKAAIEKQKEKAAAKVVNSDVKDKLVDNSKEVVDEEVKEKCGNDKTSNTRLVMSKLLDFSTVNKSQTNGDLKTEALSKRNALVDYSASSDEENQ